MTAQDKQMCSFQRHFAAIDSGKLIINAVGVPSDASWLRWYRDCYHGDAGRIIVTRLRALR